MALYTDPDTITRDILPVKDDEIDINVIIRAAVVAYNLVNSKLSGIYSVPFAATPPLIKDISDMLTRALAIIWSVDVNVKVNLDEEGGDAGMAWQLLKEVVTGGLELLDSSGDEIGRLAARGAWHSMEDVMHIFDLDDAMEQIPERSYMENLIDQRDDATKS